MLAIICPGQGSQTPGFLQPWLDLDGVSDRLTALGEAAQVDLPAHGTTSDADTIKDTAVAQPLIVAAGLVTLAAALGDTPIKQVAGLAGGHSVGEITAAAATGVLSDQDAMEFVRVRSTGMASASAATPTGMTAVLGGDPEQVLATLEQHGLTPANNNGGGQIVAAGTQAQLAALAQDPPAKARVIPLSVAGAFHTAHMAPAVTALRELADTLTAADPSVPLLSNADGSVVTSGPDFLASLVAQVWHPVRWDLCMATMVERGVTGILELAPGGTLTGLAKRGMRGVASVALKTPDDLDAARALIAEHGAS